MSSTAVRWTGTALVGCALAAALATTEATAQTVLRSPSSPPLTPPAATVRLPPKVSVLPKVLNTGACGVAQVQCFVAGGRVPTTVAEGSAASFRMKTCARLDDPRFGCGTCNRCWLANTVDAFCGPKGCDYRTCAPGFVDGDGDRRNGCELHRPGRPPPRPAPAGPRCTRDGDCAYLTTPKIGYGDCAPSKAGADARGCVLEVPQCGRFSMIGDDGKCFTPAHTFWDADGDGSRSVEYGGDDCDDSDPSAFPGNAETCDAYHHDEDCNTETFGVRDVDRDGQPDARCCNVTGEGRKKCGSDCDDGNAALVSGGMRCTAAGEAEICAGGQWDKRPCPAGTRCIPQPNGTGVCR